MKVFVLNQTLCWNKQYVRHTNEREGKKIVYISERRRKKTGNFLFVSGHPPPMEFGVAVFGKVGATITEEEAVISARATGLNMLASIKQQLGDLQKIYRIVKLNGMVNSAPGFQRQFAVIDGASNLFLTTLTLV